MDPIQNISKFLIHHSEINFRDQTVRYLLTMVDDLLTNNRKNITLFHEFGVTIGQNAWTPFMNLLSRQGMTLFIIVVI